MDTGSRICLRSVASCLASCDCFLVLASTGLAADSFRSRCGSVHGAPVCSSQTSRTAALQVSQGTDNICFGVSSLVFTGPSCNVSDYEKCSILIIRIKSSLMFNAPADSCWPVSKTEHLQRFAPFHFFSLCGSWSLLFRNAEVLIQETINSDQFFKSESLILVTQRGFNDKGKDREQTWPYGGFR